ncbi:aquaporin-12-like isoform X2 [Aquila chrysaetos chrysaetos]|uniref:aquaporin-12-like isoform X2 n=1 Tax=Aquila chrysaetos chrysaetos TaxID=223781 RepID=UPI001B7D405B|nr:aquaporin-12-like isoform X2 [Aquila chrysaetos chrysaetos]
MCSVSQACWAVPRLLTHGFIKRRCRSFLCSFPGFGSVSLPCTALAMAGLNVSIAFFFLVVGVCQVLRQLSKRLLSPGAYGCLARELAGSLQLCTSCLELRMLLEIGLWGGGFGPDVVLTLLFLLFVVHGASFDGASANPTISLQEFLLLESNLAATAAKLLAQGVGMGMGWAVTKLYWSWELTHFHLIQNLIASECSSSIHTSLHHAAFVEGTCSFFFHLVLLKLCQSHLMYRVPALAATVTFLTYTGMLAALLLYQGNIPRLFQKNLLYSQKSKYKIPKARMVAQVEGDKLQQKRKGEKSNSNPCA